MENEPEKNPPRKRHKGVAFFFASIGLLLLDGVADSLAMHKTGMIEWMLVIAGAALLFLAVLRGTGRV